MYTSATVLNPPYIYFIFCREVTLNLVRRAEAAGFTALVLTVDAPMFGIRHADARNKFALPPHLTMANFVGQNATLVNSSQGGSGINEYVGALFDPSITWADVKWLKKYVKCIRKLGISNLTIRVWSLMA